MHLQLQVRAVSRKFNVLIRPHRDAQWRYYKTLDNLHSATSEAKRAPEPHAVVVHGEVMATMKRYAEDPSEHLFLKAPPVGRNTFESIIVRRRLNREGFRETEKNADDEAKEIYKVANAIDNSKMAGWHGRRKLIKARNKVTSEIFKHKYNPLPEGKELEMGKEEEKEHTRGDRFKELKKAVHTSPEKTAMTIAKQHLKDRPDYYSTLKKAGLAEAIEAIKSGAPVDEAIYEALLPAGGPKAFVMIPHSAKGANGQPVTREFLSNTSGIKTMGRRGGTLHTPSYARHGGEKHHCVEFSCRKHAEMFASTLTSNGVEGHQVTGG
jgi:hypothetical protein